MTFRSKAGHTYVSVTVGGIDREDYSSEGIYTLKLKYEEGKLHIIP